MTRPRLGGKRAAMRRLACLVLLCALGCESVDLPLPETPEELVSEAKKSSTKSTQRMPNMAMPTTAASMKLARLRPGATCCTSSVSPTIISGYIIR